MEVIRIIKNHLKHSLLKLFLEISQALYWPGHILAEFSLGLNGSLGQCDQFYLVCFCFISYELYLIFRIFSILYSPNTLFLNSFAVTYELTLNKLPYFSLIIELVWLSLPFILPNSYQLPAFPFLFRNNVNFS